MSDGRSYHYQGENHWPDSGIELTGWHQGDFYSVSNARIVSNLLGVFVPVYFEHQINDWPSHQTWGAMPHNSNEAPPGWTNGHWTAPGAVVSPVVVTPAPAPAPVAVREAHPAHPPFPYIKWTEANFKYIYAQENHFPANGKSVSALGNINPDVNADWISSEKARWVRAACATLGVDYIPIYKGSDVTNWGTNGPVPPVNPRPKRCLPFPFLEIHSGDYRLIKNELAIAEHEYGHVGGSQDSVVFYGRPADGVIGAQKMAKIDLGLSTNSPDLPVLSFDQIKAALIEFSGLKLPFILKALTSTGPKYWLATNWDQVNRVGRGGTGSAGTTYGAHELVDAVVNAHALLQAKEYLNDPDLPDPRIYTSEELKAAIEAVWKVPPGIGLPAPPPKPREIPLKELTGDALTNYLKNLLGHSLYEQVSKWPQNPDTRGLLMAKIGLHTAGQYPFPEKEQMGAEDGQLMLDWIRDNYVGPKPKEVPAPLPVPPPAPPPPPRPPSRRFETSWTEDVYGRASFTRTDGYSAEVELDDEEILEIAEHSDSRDDFERRLHDRIEELAIDNGSCNESTDTQYDNEEVEGGEGTENFEINSFHRIVDALVEENRDIAIAIGELEDEPDEVEEEEAVEEPVQPF